MRKRKAEREKEGKKKEGGGRQGRKEEIKGGRRKERRKGNGREPKRRESSVLQLFASSHGINAPSIDGLFQTRFQ